MRALSSNWPTVAEAETPAFRRGEAFGFWDGVFRTLALEAALVVAGAIGWWLG